MRSAIRKRLGATLTLAVAVVLLLPSTALSAGKHLAPARTVADVDFLGEVVIPTGTVFQGTEIGGLSSITYDARRRLYYTLSDDQGNRSTGDPVRYYTAQIDFDDGTLDDGDITFVDVTQLFERGNEPYPPGGLDPEGLVVAGSSNWLFMSSEGIVADPIIDPFIRRYNRAGRLTGELPIPDKYLPNGIDRGVRFNLAFESLNLTPDDRFLVTAGEGALFQDGPASTFTNGSLARILTFDLYKQRAISEFVYEVGPWGERNRRGVADRRRRHDAGHGALVLGGRSPWWRHR